MSKTSDGIKILERMIGRDRKMRELVARADVNAEVAQLVYAVRRRSGLTQQQLARLIGTSQPVIARLEDADYRGHSLSMLQRIAAALNQRLELRLAPARREKRKEKAA